MADFNLPQGYPVAVGVSGGADSLFLSLMMKKWSLDTGHKVVALTVNHNLRPEAEVEAKTVSVQMKKGDGEYAEVLIEPAHLRF